MDQSGNSILDITVLSTLWLVLTVLSNCLVRKRWCGVVWSRLSIIIIRLTKLVTDIAPLVLCLDAAHGDSLGSLVLYYVVFTLNSDKQKHLVNIEKYQN